MAAAHGALELVLMLLQMGAYVDARDVEGYTPLIMVVQMDDYMLHPLSCSFDPSSRSKDSESLKFLNASSEHPMFPIITALLDAGADVDASEDRGWTALHFAAQNGLVDAVKLLISRGAKIIRSKNEMYPIHTAALGGSVEMLKLLLENGDLLDRPDVQMSALRRACDLGNEAFVREVLALSSNKLERGAICDACSIDNIEIVKLLLDLGGDINETDQWGYTPLQTALSFGNSQLANMLLDMGAAWRPENPNVTPSVCTLYLACSAGLVDIVKRLIEMGTDVSSADSAGLYPLMGAAASGNLELVKMLVQHGAFPAEDSTSRALLVAIRGIPKLKVWSEPTTEEYQLRGKYEEIAIYLLNNGSLINVDIITLAASKVYP